MEQTQSPHDTEVMNSDEFDELLDEADPKAFARLIPLNGGARDAMGWYARRGALVVRNVEYGDAPLSPEEKNCVKNTAYHAKFVESVSRDGLITACFVFSLKSLPLQPELGWRIGDGNTGLPNLGVDLLLDYAGDDSDVVSKHARFSWRKGCADFFLVSDRQDVVTRLGKKLIQGTLDKDGNSVSSWNAIHDENTILLGDHLFFTLEYAQWWRIEEQEFSKDLHAFLSGIHADPNPLVLPTPQANDSFLGSWKIRHLINGGTFGKVVMVTHRTTGEPGAAKIISQRNIGGQPNDPQFSQELIMAQLLKEQSHPFVIRPLALFEMRGIQPPEEERIRTLLDANWTSHFFREYVIVLPFLTGTLKDVLKSNMDRNARTRCLEQVLSGLAFLHHNAIIHRDIKPSNVAISTYRPPTCKLIDFGSASLSVRNSYDKPGTIIYLAPEQVPGMEHGEEVDLWACGILGAELLGWHHRDRITAGNSLAAIREYLLDNDSTISRVCLEMLVVDPAQRITAKKAFRFMYNERQEDFRGTKRPRQTSISETSSGSSL